MWKNIKVISLKCVGHLLSINTWIVDTDQYFLQAKMFILKICKHASSAIPLCELNVGPVISIFTDLLKFQIKHCPISLKLGGHLASIENKDNNLLLIYAVIKPLSRTNTWQWTTSVAVQNISCPISLKKVSAGTNSASQ